MTTTNRPVTNHTTLTTRGIAATTWLVTLLLAGMSLGAGNRNYLVAAFVTLAVGIAVDVGTTVYRRRTARAQD